jgi:hypothetical protein
MKQFEFEDNIPRIALRERYQDGTLDDVVLGNVKWVHIETTSDDNIWMGVYFTNGERICFDINMGAVPHGKKTKKIVRFIETEMPPTYIDYDEEQIQKGQKC